MSTAAAIPVHERRYVRVKRHVLELIAGLPVGSSIPAERELSIALQTSRAAVRQAIGELVSEGRLTRRRGAGTFVASPKLAWPLRLSGFTAEGVAAGFAVTTSLVSAAVLAADSSVARALVVEAGSSVLCVERLRTVGGAPMALERCHLPLGRLALRPDDLRDGSLYDLLLEKFGVRVAHAVETIETAPAGPHEAELLGCEPSAPMLVLTRQSFDESGVPLEWVKGWYRGDRYTLVARLH